MTRLVGQRPRHEVDPGALAVGVQGLSRLVPHSEIAWLFDGTRGIQEWPLASARVLVLDEPGRRLHSHAWAHLWLLEQRGAAPQDSQMLVITHAVQLVPLAHPESIRHVTHTNGVTQTWVLTPAQSDHVDDALKRRNKWERSLL